MQSDKTPVVIMAVVMTVLGLGLTVAFRSNAPRPPVVPTSTPVVLPTQAAPSDVAVLLVGVDSLAAPVPTLETVAVIRYHVGVDQYFIFSVSPDAVVADHNLTQRSLRSVYALDAQYTRGATFTKDVIRHAVPGIGDLTPEIDFDRQSLTETIRQLGLITFRGERLDGPAWLARFDALPPHAKQERLEFQKELAEALFAAAKGRHWDLPRLAIVLGRRFYPDMRSVLPLLSTAPPFARADFTMTDAPLILPVTPMP